jgi:hypothetical protein
MKISSKTINKNKSLLTLATVFFMTFAVQSNAAEEFLGFKGNAYVGTDYIYSEMKRKFLADPLLVGDPERPSVRGQDSGYGINFGYKISKNNIFIAPEIFYEKLNVHAADYYNSATTSDSLKVESREGVKVALGYTFFDKLSIFGNYGFTKVHFRQNVANFGDIYSFNKSAPIYGFGISYRIYKDVDLRLSHDIQTIKTLYDKNFADNGDQKDMTKIRATKVGLVYNF